jgi:6-phosphogluconolactonase (cycloisomerase 2 family)
MKRSRGVSLGIVGICLLAASCGGSYSGGGGTTAGGGATTSERDVVYVLSSTSSGQVATLSFDSGSGQLTAATPTVGPPGGLDIAVDPAASFLYAADFNSGSVYGYSRDAATGALSAVSGSPFLQIGSPSNGGPIAIKPDGMFLFHSNAFGSITSYSINTNGVLAPTSNPAVSDCLQPIHLLVAPSGKFLYAANRGDPSGAEYCVYSIDPSSGALTAIPGSPFTFRQNSEPWGLAFGSGGSLLYSTLSNAQGVDGLSVDTNSGALSELSGAPYSAGFIPQGLAIGANGEYLYAGNEGDGSLSIFKIDQTTGVLTASGSLAAGNPSFLAASPSGQYLFVLGQDTRQLSVYRIDSSSGNLSQVTSTTVSGGTNLPALAVVGLK